MKDTRYSHGARNIIATRKMFNVLRECVSFGISDDEISIKD